MSQMITSARRRIEFGDFQTPRQLADSVCRLLRRRRINPAMIIEPTCGVGTFLAAAMESFPDTQSAVGLEINPDYVAQAKTAIASLKSSVVPVVRQADFFATDWPALLAPLPDPLLVIGNPPWVTNAALGGLRGANLPQKSNHHGHAGLDAITGKSNFDISEWMLSHLLSGLDQRKATLAMLCKTSVARKVLAHAWKRKASIRRAELHRLNAVEYFDAAVDACLLICALAPTEESADCHVYDELGSPTQSQTFGYCDGTLIADLPQYRKWKRLCGPSPYVWRSGIKHDCSRVMEFVTSSEGLRNGLGELVHLEETHLFPMLKSSDLAPGGTAVPVRKMLVPQRAIGEETAPLEHAACATWSYLVSHAERLDHRRSSIYRHRPRFSIFGVGSYSFSPWKVAISGFYKSLNFAVVGPQDGKSTVVDDTGYFLPCRTASEARCLQRLLSSDPARELLSAFIFWDAKRPITCEILSRIHLRSVASELQMEEEFDRHVRKNPWARGISAEADGS